MRFNIQFFTVSSCMLISLLVFAPDEQNSTNKKLFINLLKVLEEEKDLNEPKEHGIIGIITGRHKLKSSGDSSRTSSRSQSPLGFFREDQECTEKNVLPTIQELSDSDQEKED